MNRRIRQIAIWSTALAAAFGLGAIVAVDQHWEKPLAVVTVENQSGKSITNVAISLTTCGTQRTISQRTEDVQDYSHQSSAFVFTLPLCGEGGHRTKVEFSDGKSVESAGSYIMNGTRIVERVQADKITTEFGLLRY